MKCNLAGACRNAADTMQAMIDELKSRMGRRAWRDFNYRHKPELYEHILRNEIAKHADQVTNGEEPLSEFGRHYCLTQEGGE
jgi:hypothetical protein